MSENEMSQQERDAAVIASMQQHIAKAVYEDPPQSDMFLISTNMRDIIEYALAERRERMRLRAENDRLRAAACDVDEVLDQAANDHDRKFGGTSLHIRSYSERMRQRAKALRAALASAERDGAGTDAGDATAGDGDGGAS